jgi:hypothetical protein
MNKETTNMETKNENGNGSKVTALQTRPAAPALPAVYEPRNFEEAMRIALVYASSGLLGEVRSQEAALVIMATGAELGIPATTALRAIYIVKGKPILSSDLIVALCLKRTDICEYFICIESTATQATYETKRIGVQAPIRNTFTLEDAKRAKLGLEWDKSHGKLIQSEDSNWAKYPKAMLRHRSAAELARQVYPDIVLGLYTIADEDEIAREAIDVTPAPQLVTTPIVEQEALSVSMERWAALFAKAKTVGDCDTVRLEAKARVSKGMPEYDLLAKAYAARTKALRDAPAGTAVVPAAPAAPAAPVDADVVDPDSGNA